VSEELSTAKEIISRVLDSASIRNFVITKAGTQFKVVVPADYYVTEICLKELESNGYPVKTIHGDDKGLEIILGGNKK
jgi:hypothetical protein